MAGRSLSSKAATFESRANKIPAPQMAREKETVLSNEIQAGVSLCNWPSPGDGLYNEEARAFEAIRDGLYCSYALPVHALCR